MHPNQDVIEQRIEVREVITISTGRVFQAEGMTNAKALGWEYVWCVGERTKPVELEWS